MYQKIPRECRIITIIIIAKRTQSVTFSLLGTPAEIYRRALVAVIVSLLGYDDRIGGLRATFRLR